ncbi:Coenzyme A biosynthesis protein 3 [Colletotrichum gloeosporioides]|uniref:Flavoprotein n=2 Tax=Colletotrichum gloeosporioides TaxID=474922 RepID=T0K3V0_COLGC|nr:Coenzyme A biosynthesis protein 3 [Colletotrichum gloeosporioides]EQB47428.1 flavoprotein [Colletotrichum gloeosporioides Cg-14]KAF3809039.1 Coenzyme A biosynthesis protein 3 [Colletotrichum gloeosporioides]
MSDPAAEVAASRDDGKVHLLLCASGSVATIKIPNIIEALGKHENLSIRLILTASAAQFLTGNTEEQPSLATIRKMKNVDGIHLDEEEWVSPWRRGASILHIELRRWADMMLIAPLSANTLAKIVNGFSDNLLLSVVRAWDPEGLIDGRKKRILVASAMNSAMHNHPITGKQLSALREWNWFEVLQPMEKTLACGDTGSGAMMDWREIVQITEARLGLSKE